MNKSLPPVAVRAFIGLGVASLVCQFIKITLWWNASQELVRAISEFHPPSVEATGHALRIAGFFLCLGMVYLIIKNRSHLARLIYLVATAIVIVSLAASFLAFDVDVWGNKWGILASLLQVGAASCLLTRGFRLWLRAPAARALSGIFS
jgi:hypothetical protein